MGAGTSGGVDGSFAPSVLDDDNFLEDEITDRGDVGDFSLSSFLLVVVGVDVDFSPCSDIMSGDAAETSVDEGR